MLSMRLRQTFNAQTCEMTAARNLLPHRALLTSVSRSGAAHAGQACRIGESGAGRSAATECAGLDGRLRCWRKAASRRIGVACAMRRAAMWLAQTRRIRLHPSRRRLRRWQNATVGRNARPGRNSGRYGARLVAASAYGKASFVSCRISLKGGRVDCRR